MDLRHAKTFVTVADLGTVSSAAQHLHVAQPALSRQIADFERTLGVKLFDRVGRRLLLTAAGEQLLLDCRALLDRAAAIEAHAKRLQLGDVGVLKLASSPQFIEGALSTFLTQYAAQYPKVQVKLTEALGWAATAAKLECGDILLGQNLVGAVPPDDAQFACHPLEPIDLLAAYGTAIELGDGEAVEIERLSSHPLLVLDTEYVFRRNFDRACRVAGIQPRIVLESRTPHTLLAMAEAGHGVAIVPSALRTDRYRLRIAAVAQHGEPLRERAAIFWNARRPLPRYAEAFCSMLGAYMQEVFPISRPTKIARIRP
jgi:DNA-binding transcriptional LysR family regulator